LELSHKKALKMRQNRAIMPSYFNLFHHASQSKTPQEIEYHLGRDRRVHCRLNDPRLPAVFVQIVSKKAAPYGAAFH